MDDSDEKTRHDASPFASKDDVAARFWAKTQQMPSGCLKWTGSSCKRVGNRPDEGQFYVRVQKHVYKTVSASRVAWWLAGNSWPAPRAQLRHTCGHRNCVAVQHLTLVTIEARTKLTPQLRAEIKELYALRVAVQREVFGKLGASRRPTAKSLTGKRLWVSRDTIDKWQRGEKMSPRHWKAMDSSIDELAAVYELAKRDADDIKNKLDAVKEYSIASLAARYRVSSSLITRALYD